MVRSRFLEWQPGGMEPNAQSPVEWLVRWYLGLGSDDAKQRLARACAASLLDPEPEVRSGAIHFFADLGYVPDDGALVAAFTAHDQLFLGIPDPWRFQGEDLHTELARAIAGRVQRGDLDVIELLRAEALQPGRGGVVIAGLMRIDDEGWVVANASSIIRSNPDALRALLWNLRKRERSLLSVVAAVSSVVLHDRLRDEILRAIPPGPLQDRALALVENGAISR